MFVIVINLQCVVKQYPDEFLKEQPDLDIGNFGRVIGIYVKSFPGKTDA